MRPDERRAFPTEMERKVKVELLARDRLAEN